MMRRLFRLAVAAIALAALASAASAREKFSYSGAASAGEVIELTFEDLWHHEFIGKITFEGGSLDFATMYGEATVTYAVHRPRQFFEIDVHQTCTAPDELPCPEFKNLTANSVQFSTPFFDPNFTSRWIPDDPLPGPGSFNGWHHKTYSTLTVGFTPDGGGEVTYRIDGLATAPEPATWALMIGGFGIAGASLRRRGRGGVSRSLLS
jgi:hypothetical protein